jgi:hypothetical protein
LILPEDVNRAGYSPAQVDAGQALIVDNSFSLENCMTIEPAPEHAAIWLRSEGACCVFSGDIVHHLVQLRHPDWSCMGCQDLNQSASTRSALLSKIADADVHLMTGIFWRRTPTELIDRAKVQVGMPFLRPELGMRWEQSVMEDTKRALALPLGCEWPLLAQSGRSDLT